MKRLPAYSVVVLAVAALLVALSLVTWRQARALETLAAVDSVRREQALARAEWEELVRRIQVLESRGRVVPAARERLGMEIAPSTVLLVEDGS
jgi:cell division protein FtsL